MFCGITKLLWIRGTIGSFRVLYASIGFLRHGWMIIFHRMLMLSWWRHQMETFSALLAICAGNSPVPVNYPHKGQWRGALMFSLICTRINGWVNNGEAGDLRRYRGHYDVIVMVVINTCHRIHGCHTGYHGPDGPAPVIDMNVLK